MLALGRKHATRNLGCMAPGAMTDRWLKVGNDGRQLRSITNFWKAGSINHLYAESLSSSFILGKEFLATLSLYVSLLIEVMHIKIL
jgi:hypothetical protein